MTCYHTWRATQLTDGRIVPVARHGMDVKGEISLPCGKCIGCRRDKQRAWTIRCLHEAQETRDKNGKQLQSSFITLTYNEEHYTPILEKEHWQKFIDRLRKRMGPTRYFACGEYGPQDQRPHWHACLFGRTFPKDYPVNADAWGSHLLDEIWGKGYASHGQVTHASAAYVAGYCVKKLAGERTISTIVDIRTGEITPRPPERGYMSLRPGIGEKWLKKYWKDVYNVRDGIVQKGGLTLPPPKYYDKLMEKINAELIELKKYEREKKAEARQNENTEQRLRVREKVEIAKQQQKRQR